MISQEYMEFLDKLTVKLGTARDLDNAWQTFIFIWDKSQVLDFDYQEVDRLKSKLTQLAELALGRLTIMKTFSEDHEYQEHVIIENLMNLHRNKNAGYSGDDPDPWKNFRVVKAFGISPVIGCLTRLCDKYARYCVLLENPDQDKVGESIEDTLMDFIAYCGIMICLLHEL